MVTFQKDFRDSSRCPVGRKSGWWGSPCHSGWAVRHTGSARAMQELDGGGVSVGRGQEGSVKDNVTATSQGRAHGCPRGRVQGRGSLLASPWLVAETPVDCWSQGVCSSLERGGVRLSPGERRDKAPWGNKGPLCTGCLQHTRSPVHSSSVWPVTRPRATPLACIGNPRAKPDHVQALGPRDLSASR